MMLISTKCIFKGFLRNARTFFSAFDCTKLKSRLHEFVCIIIHLLIYIFTSKIVVKMIFKLYFLLCISISIPMFYAPNNFSCKIKTERSYNY